MKGTSRIVLDVSEMPVSWTQSYNEETCSYIELRGYYKWFNWPISQNDKNGEFLKALVYNRLMGALR